MKKFQDLSKLAAAGGVAVLVVLITHAAYAGPKERLYTMGDDDPGAVIGGTPPGLMTVDVNPSTQDSGGSLVPMTSFGETDAPRYVAAADRPGAAAGNLALEFDGVNDYMFGATYDPRNFDGFFSAVAQAWVKPAVAATGADQFIFRVGNENGSIKISPDGFWTLQTTNAADGVVVSNFAVEANEWTHVAVLRGGNASQLFINGSVAANDPGFWGGPGPEVALGGDVGAIGGLFQGVIDSFSIGTNFSAEPGGFNTTVHLDFFPDSGITFSNVAGDIDQDGVGGDPDDYQIWSENVGFNNGFGVGDPGLLLLGDANQSGVIDLHDFLIINQAALNPPMPGAGAGTGVPEPTSLALLSLGAAALAMSRSRRRRRSSPPWAAVILVGVAALSNVDRSAEAAVVAADDFLYDGATKQINVGGGFNGFQLYRGGQNGSAGNWVGVWGQIGDGIITTAEYSPPNPEEPGTPANVAMYDGFFGVQSELFRDFELADSVSPTQTLYFGGRFKADLEIGTEGGLIPQFYAPRLFLNRIAGDDRYVDIDTTTPEVIDQRDRTQDIGLGFESFRNINTQAIDNFVVARLGAGPEVRTSIAMAPPSDGNWHTVVGKLEVNAAGANERLTVWFDPTGVESGGTMAQVEADVLPDLGALIGTLHSQGTRPVNPVDDPTFPIDPVDILIEAPAEAGRSYIDDMAIGTTWQDVATVNVPRLTLRINPTTGSGTLVNSTSESLQLNGYSLESDSGALNGTDWNSLDEQNMGNWQQNLATAKQLVETFLAGSTTIAPGGQLALGNLFTTTGMQDVTGRFTTPDNLLNLLHVEYGATVGVQGDYNNNGTVDAADYVLWRDGGPLQNEGASPGQIDQADYDFWRSRFGATAGSGSAAAHSAAVPEPTTLVLATLLACAGWRRVGAIRCPPLA